MAKKKKRKKGNRKLRTARSALAKRQAEALETSENNALEGASPRRDGPTESAFYTILTLFPLLSGVIVSSYTPELKWESFYLVFGVAICGIYLSYLGKRSGRLFVANLKTAILYGAAILLSFVFYNVTQSADATGLLVASIFCGVISDGITVTSVARIFIVAVARVMQMSLLAVLGVFTQSEVLVWSTGVLGFGPGCMLASLYFVEHAGLMEAIGWTRNRDVNHKTKGMIRRPGRVTQSFSFFYVIGPAVCAVMAPLGILPMQFAVAGLFMIILPRALMAFAARSAPDFYICRRVIVMSAWFAITLLGIGVGSRI